MAKSRNLITKLCFALVAVALVAGPLTQQVAAAVKKEIDIKLGAKERAKFKVDHLMNLLEQAIEWNYSSDMIEEIMKLFQVRYKGGARLPSSLGGIDSEAWKRMMREQLLLRQKMAKEFADRAKGRFDSDGSKIKPDDPTFGPGGGKTTLVDPGSGTDPIDWSTKGGIDEALRKLRESGHLDKDLLNSLALLQRTAKSVPLKEARRLEGLINNAILDALKGKDYEVAALGVYLHSSNEIKVILIVTSSNMPRSRIRVTLTDIRGIIETDVLKAKFPQFKLAQLSSFTILNEVENHFYEHAVLYWQMQVPGWQVPVKSVPISRPVTIDRRAATTTTKERPSIFHTDPKDETPADMEFDETDFLDTEEGI